MSTVDESVVLLAPEEESVPEHAQHQRIVDPLYAGVAARFADRADAQAVRADSEAARAERLAARLREAGLSDA